MASKIKTCPFVPYGENAPEPIFGNVTFYHFNLVLSGICTALVIIMTTFFWFMHATHLRKPNEQVKIMRISAIMPNYAVLCLLSIWLPQANVYLEPWLEFVQSISLSAFFLLVLEYIENNPARRDAFFADLKIKHKKAPGGLINGLPWIRKQWVMIFQYPVVAFLVAIATIVTQLAGVYCEVASLPRFAKLWLTIIKSISLSVAIQGIINVYINLKAHIAEHRPLLKLLSFKLIVTLTFFCSILFLILSATGTLKPTPQLVYADLHVGLIKLITCVAMVPLTVLLIYAYPWQPYKLPRRSKAGVVGGNDGLGAYSAADYADGGLSYQGGPLGIYAFAAQLSPMETIRGVVTAIGYITGAGGPGIGPGLRRKDDALEVSSQDDSTAYSYEQQTYGYDSQPQQQPPAAYGHGGHRSQGSYGAYDPQPSPPSRHNEPVYGQQVYEPPYMSDQQRLLTR